MPEAPLMLTVSGARGIVGESMTPAVARDYAAAFGTFVIESTGSQNPTICIGRDSRPSGEELTAAAAEGFLGRGCRLIDLGVVATPTVGVMLAKYGASGGMVVTASHNPIEWNGLKCLNANGVAPPPKEIERIIDLFHSRAFIRGSGGSIVADHSGNDNHVAAVLLAINPQPIRESRFKVVLDSVNGAGCVAGRMVLEALGCEVVHLNGEPTGHFAHTPEPLEENLHDLAANTRAANAVCGFAQDPDADRLAIVDETGRYIGEEYSLVLAARRILQMKRTGTIVTNLSSSRMVDDLAGQYPGIRVSRTAVGEANVVAAMMESGAIIGGEGNGGVIFPPPHGVCWVRDSLSAMALVLGLLAQEKRPLSAIIDEMPRYAMIKEKLTLSPHGGRDAIARVKDFFADAKINAADGVRVDLRGEENGWVHLRPSNTEPILRIIAEASTATRARELVELVRAKAGLSESG